MPTWCQPLAVHGLLWTTRSRTEETDRRSSTWTDPGATWPLRSKATPRNLTSGVREEAVPGRAEGSLIDIGTELGIAASGVQPADGADDGAAPGLLVDRRTPHGDR